MCNQLRRVIVSDRPYKSCFPIWTVFGQFKNPSSNAFDRGGGSYINPVFEERAFWNRNREKVGPECDLSSSFTIARTKGEVGGVDLDALEAFNELSLSLIIKS
jgi:hypothetical protein